MHDLHEKIKAWLPLEQIEPEALAQLHNTAAMPFVEPWLAVMPDCHLGKGSTVGSVIPTVGAIMPAAVGVDIGCGMGAVLTSLMVEDVQDKLEAIRLEIERAIPLGIGTRGYNSKIEPSAQEHVTALEGRAKRDYAQVDPNWRTQLGSLGGGNHFIELCRDEQARVWVLLHSGSRGIGNKLANLHIKVAQGLMKRFHIKLVDPDLAYIPDATPEFGAYMADLHWAQQFAFLNRHEMLDRVMRQIAHVLKGSWQLAGSLEQDRILSHHNYTAKERHFGRDVWVTRKGAVRAQVEDRALIPGSMGTPSYIVQGKGCRLAFNSAPHGAGRRMSRTKARQCFTLENLTERMAGIEARVRPAVLDEHPDAYKDIDVVIGNAGELVEPLHKLHQLLNVKGD